MAPPSTPSPFRFSRKRDDARHGSSGADARSRSSLFQSSFTIGNREEPPEPAQTPHSYAAENRSETERPAELGDQTVKRISSALRRRAPHREVIQDVSQESQGDNSAPQYDVSFSPSKRRRLSLEDKSVPVQKFIPGAAAGQDILANESVASIRPPFIFQQSTQALPVAEPLPEAFSPHRRGRKFIPGGMAEMMQGWVMEVAHGIHRQAAPEVVSLQVTDIDGGSGTFDLVKAGSENVLLVRTGGQRSDFLRTGAVIQVRRPFWNTTVDGTTWMIAVDWKIA